MKEISYVMIKPGFAHHPKVVKEIRKRINEAGLEITKSSYIKYTEEDAKKHYAEHVGKSFYPGLEEYITSDIAFGMVVEGENAISTIRYMVEREKGKVQPGEIRYDIPMMINEPIDRRRNVIHASDCVESALNEIAVFDSICEREASASTEPECE